MGGIIVASLTTLYALLFLFFIIGLVRTHRYKGPKATPSVSVVVPMRNEEEFAQRTLEALAEQDYAAARFLRSSPPPTRNSACFRCRKTCL